MSNFEPIVSPYFGKDGLTSTSADFYANLAKHAYEKIEAELASLSFVTEELQLIGNSTVTNTKIASYTTFEMLKDKLDKVAELKSFCAFLREAIKAKNKLSEEIDDFILEERNELKYPVMQKGITEEEVINNMSVKERERYLTLETYAAVYGKYLHPNGIYSNARREAFNAISNPAKYQLEGNNTIIVMKRLSISTETIDADYENLLKIHRSFEAELNGLKNKIKETIDNDAHEKFEQFKVDVKEYNALNTELLNKERELREQRRNEVKALKIVIPNKFKALYESLSKSITN